MIEMVFALALGLAWQDAEEGKKPEFAGLIRRIVDGDVRVRERASQELMKAGAGAIPELRKAVRSSDPELAARAREILAAIEEETAPTLAILEEGGKLIMVKMGGSVVRTVEGFPPRANFPRVSPDGRRVVFTAGDGENPDVFVRDLEAAEAVNLTRSHAIESHPAWSPDGKRIVYSVYENGNWDTWVMNDDGTHPVDITRTPFDDCDPAWSPDGRRIAVVRRTDGWRLCTMNLDGTDARELLSESLPGYTFPAWSPDGKQIAFALGVAPRPALAILDLERNAVRTITESDGSRVHSYARWSPDGRYIGYVKEGPAGDEGERILMVCDTFTGKHRKISGERIKLRTPYFDWVPRPAVEKR